MSYIIAGRAIKSEYLAIGTLLGTVGLAIGLSGGDKKASPASQAAAVSTPSFGASSKEEEDFIRNFVAEAEKADKGGKH